MTVVIPSFNSEVHIKNCVNSVLEQSYKNVEVIVVDDCSSDNTKLILGEVDDSRLSTIALDVNVGGAEARNIGVRHAKGSYIAFLDSDDTFMANKVEEQLSRMLDQGLNFSYTKGVEEFSVTRGTGFGDSLLNDLLTGNACIGSSSGIMVSKHLHELLNGFDPEFKRQQDIEYACRASTYRHAGFLDFIGYRKINSGSPSLANVRQGMEMLWSKFRNNIEAMTWQDKRNVYLRGYIRFFELSMSEKNIKGLYYLPIVICLGPSVFWTKRKSYIHKFSTLKK